MTQEAIVNRLTDNNCAMVKVTRLTACGGNCENCEACVTAGQVDAVAANPLNAQPGDRVIIEGKTSRVMQAIALVYVLPILLLIAGYAAAYLLGAAEGLCILAAFAGVILGGVIIVWSQKNSRRMQFTYEIIEILKENSGV